MAQNTMNTNSKDVVKSVESTSNEQRQTVKPIVISRRRLLRAGVAGIPVVLTMAGVAPGIEGINAASAASGLNYDGLGTVDRISQLQEPDENGLIWSDSEGFVLTGQHGGHYKSENALSATGAFSSVPVSLSFTKTENNNNENTSTENLTVTLNLSDNITGSAHLHKLGNFYISKDDISLEGTTINADLPLSFSISELSVIESSSVSPTTYTATNPEFVLSSSPDQQTWYCLTGDNPTIPTITVKIKVTGLSFTKDGYTYTYSASEGSGGTEFTFNVNPSVNSNLHKLQ